MKIVQVSPRYMPQKGGVETHVREISERLVDRGHDVVVHTADAGTGCLRGEVRNGVDVRRHLGLAPGSAIHAAPGIYSSVRRSRADVIHAHNYHSLPLLFASLGATSAQNTVMTPHYHGSSESGWRDQLLRLYHPIGRWALSRADTVIAVSRFERDQLRDTFGIDPLVIPNGVDIQRFGAVQTMKRGEEEPYILSVGRLKRYKGVQHAVRALDHLPEYRLLIAGGGDYTGELTRIAEQAGVSERVELLGYVHDDELPQLYAGADVYVNLSEFEAFGMTVAEALATGTPCVVRAGSGLDDWEENSGVVRISSTNPEAVGKAIRRASGRRPDDTNIHDWDEIVDRLEDVYLGNR